MKNGFGLTLRVMFALALCSVCATSLALGPHETIVIANDASIRSVLVAKAYARMRQIPECNVIRLDLPDAADGTNLAISVEQFNREIFGPVSEILKERKIDSQIRAWAYSCDFPTKVATRPEMSLTGITFMRGVAPSTNEVDKGTYTSPLFAGPMSRDSSSVKSQTIDKARIRLLERTPILSMMLGYAGDRGNTEDEIIGALERTVKADGTFPRGKFYFTTSDDIRSKCRQWQFDGAIEALGVLGFDAVATNSYPMGEGMLGFMCGAVSVPTRFLKFAPGAYADHLTSYAGAFDRPSQTKMSEWIRAGASGTSGTVTEPYSTWFKFPSAFLFVHQARGCTMAESFYQSVKCPLQILPMGDPLSAPWAKRMQVMIGGVSGTRVRGIVTLTAATDSDDDDLRFDWLVDGRIVSSGARFNFDTTKRKNGQHMIRVVARGTGDVRCQDFQEIVLEVNN